jgi:predicted DNA-binding antitoxin AbrB/MazE fold protein
MVQNVDAIYDRGVLRPIEPLSLPEGTHVHLRVEQQNGNPATSTDHNAWLDNVAGRWQGDFTREESNLGRRD